MIFALSSTFVLTTSCSVVSDTPYISKAVQNAVRAASSAVRSSEVDTASFAFLLAGLVK